MEYVTFLFVAALDYKPVSAGLLGWTVLRGCGQGSATENHSKEGQHAPADLLTLKRRSWVAYHFATFPSS